MKKIFLSLMPVVLLSCSTLMAQTLEPEDIQDLDEKTGIGCISKKPVTDEADFYHVCMSKKSNEVAWNAALYRSKVACSSDKLSVFFNMPPSLSTENGDYGAQVEVSCNKD